MRILLVGLLLAAPLLATTKMSQAEMTVRQLSEAMRTFARRNDGSIPYGNNAAVMVLLEKVGMRVSDTARGARGEFLDQWGRPIQFLRSGDSHVVILILGDGKEPVFPYSTCVLVEGRPFEVAPSPAVE